MKPNLSPVVIVIGLSLLHVFTNPVVRHDFGAPLKHKSGIDSWILLHPDKRERRCRLRPTLYSGWLQRIEVASVCVCTPLYTRGLRVACNSLGLAKSGAHWCRSTTNSSDLQI